MKARTWGQAALRLQAKTDGPKLKWAQGWVSQEGLLRATKALALMILVYSSRKPPCGLWKCSSRWSSPLLGALLVGWVMRLLGEGSGGSNPAAPDTPMGLENLHWVMLDLLLLGSPCTRNWVSGFYRSGRSSQVITTLTKITTKAIKTPL